MASLKQQHPLLLVQNEGGLGSLTSLAPPHVTLPYHTQALTP